MNRLVLFFSLLLITAAALADCNNLYPNGRVIKVRDTIELCNSFFVSRYNESKKSVILTSNVISAKDFRVERNDSFRADPRLKSSTRAELADYRNSGFDKGHMTPAGDATNGVEMYDTFLLSNMTPQEPTLNRESWRELEMHVRSLVKYQEEDAIVLTGAIYDETNQKYVGVRKIPIPAAYYKILYLKDKTLAFYAPNIPNGKVRVSKVSELYHITGIQFP